MNGQVDTGALEEFLKGKGLLGAPPAIREELVDPVIPVAQRVADPFEKPPSVLEQGLEKPSYGERLARFLQNKGLDLKIPKIPTEDLIRPVPVTDPRAPTREQVATGIPLLTPGPEIPTPEFRPQEILDRPADYVPPPSKWQEIKDIAFLVRSGDLNAASIVARGLLKGPTGRLIDPIKLVEKISGQEGFTEEYDREVDRRLQKKTGYTPDISAKVAGRAGEFVGYLIPFSKILQGAGKVAKAATKIPILQAVARAELTGIGVGLTQTPEDDGILQRLKQVPASVAFFTVMDVGLLSAQQVLKIVRYNRAMKSYKNVDWNAIPDIPGEEAYTAKEMRDLFTKFTGNADKASAAGRQAMGIGTIPENMTKRELEILEYFKKEGGWKKAATQGWVSPPAEVPVGKPRKPRFSDIFRRPPFAPFEPGFEPPGQRPSRPSLLEPPPEPPPTEAPPAAGVRPKARPTPKDKRGVPAVVVDVNPNPEGGWTYNFKIPTAEPIAPAPMKAIDWKPIAALPEAKIPTPARVARKEKVFTNPLFQFLNLAGGVKPTLDHNYQALKQVLPFDLIRKDGQPLDIHAQAATVEFPNIENDADLMNALENIADAQAAAKFHNVTTGEEFVPPQEFFDEQLDSFILDEIKAGRGNDLDPASRERARELIELIPPEQAEKYGLDEGMARVKEIMRKRRADAEKGFPEEEIMKKIVEKDVAAAPRPTEEELKLEREEEVKPKKPAPKKEEPTLIKKEELVKPKGKYPEGFNSLGWKSIPQYQGTLTEARKTAAAGFDVEYGPVEKGDKGYVRITATRPGKKGKVIQKSLTSIPKDLEAPAGQLGIDDELSGDLFAKAAPGVREADLVEALDKLNIPAEHRGEVSISVLKTFDPKKGDLTSYIRKTIANISKRMGPEKAARLKEQRKIREEEISKEAPPSARLAEAQAEVDILEAIERATKNKKEVEVMRRRILDEDSFEDIGKTMKISRQRAQKVFADTIVKMKEDPTVIKMLEDRFKEVHAGPKPSFKEMAKTANKYFTSSKGMSDQIDAANDRRISGPIADLFLTTLEGKEIEKWIRRNNNAGLRQQVKELLTGEMSFDNIALPENAPEEALKSLRKRIDDLTTMIMVHGGLKEPTLAAFESGIGKYLGTFYRLHEYNELNKGRFIKQYWNPKQGARDRFAAALKRDDPGMFGDFTDEMMDNFLNAMLRGEDYVYKGSNRTKRVPTDHYKAQKGVSKEYEEFAGIVTDPVWLALKTVTKQTVMAHNAQFLNTLEDNPETARLITHDLKTARSRGWQGHQLPDDYSYGRLRGAWVHPELDEFIRGEVMPQESVTERMIMKFIMNPFKWTKTIGSIPTHARNFSGNPMFSFLLRDSISNPFNLPYYIQTMRIGLGRKGKFRNEWAQLIRDGVTDTQFWKSEIPAFYNELLKLDPPDWPEKIARYLFKKPASFAGELYNFEDQLYRISAHLKNIQHFKMTPAESVKELNLSSPNYRKVPKVVEWLRKYPVFGPFISFRFNVARILTNNALQAGKDLASKDPNRKIKGALRLYRLAFVVGLPLLLAGIAKKVFDVDEKKIKELERTYPDHRRGGTVIYYRDEDGKLKGYDFTYTYPTGDLVQAITNLTSGDIESFTESAQLFAHPIFDAFSILVKGRDPYWGTPIDQPVIRRVTELAKLLWLPQSAPIPSIQGLIEGIKTGDIGENLRVGKLTTYQIENLIQAYQKQEDRYGRVRKLPEELRGFFTGVRTWDVDPDVLIIQYVKQKEFELDDAERAYKRWLRKNTRAAYWQEEAERSRYEAKRTKILGDIERVGKLLESIDPTFHLRKSYRFK